MLAAVIVSRRGEVGLASKGRFSLISFNSEIVIYTRNISSERNVLPKRH